MSTTKPETEKQFFHADKSGRGGTATVTLNDLIRWETDQAVNYDGDNLKEWARDAESGDVWENAADRYTCL